MKAEQTLWCLILSGGIFIGSAMADDPIVYSGPNRNVVYGEFTFQPTISLFDAPGTWDDINLNLDVFEDPSFMNSYSFGNLLQVHGNFVEYAVGVSFFDIKRFSIGQLIGPAETFSGNNYKNFSNYREDLYPEPFTSENGEFRNTSGYAGIRMIDGTNTYYGWIQVSVSNYNNPNMSGTLIDWAYNSIPGSPIPAGMTGSPAIDSAELAIAITWQSLSNILYQVQGTDTLAPPAWTNAGQPVLGSGGQETYFEVLTNKYGHYRVILAP
jgi:hypothetical protein